MPAVSMLRTYPRGWLRHDVVAGLVMTTMLVPVGIAYAEASGLPGINGLLQAAGIGLYFAEVKDPVKDKLKRFGLFAHFGEQTFLRHY